MVLNTSEINQNLSEIKKRNQKQISDYPGLLDKIKDIVSKYIPRLKTAFCKKYEGDKITGTEKIAFEFYPDYKGDIRHLFLFYDWRKVDDFENPKLAQVCELNPNCIPDFHEVYGFYPEILSVDKGMDSEKNNKFCKDKGIGAYIQALERIANRRSECAREFSRDKWGYRRDRMSNRGDKEAELFIIQICSVNQGSIGHEFENRGLFGFTPNPHFHFQLLRPAPGSGRRLVYLYAIIIPSVRRRRDDAHGGHVTVR